MFKAQLLQAIHETEDYFSTYAEDTIKRVQDRVAQQFPLTGRDEVKITKNYLISVSLLINDI